MSDPILDRLRALEPIARGLDPGPGERASLASATMAHAEAFLAWLETAPAQAPDSGSAEALARSPIGRKPIGMERALALLAEQVDRTGQNTTAAQFFSYIPLGNLYHGALADFLAAVTNRFSASAHACLAAVRIENQVLAWLASVVGYPSGSAGNLASGGSLANLGAIVTAREAAGLRARDVERAAVYLTGGAHHCVTKGLRVAGLGECILRRIPTDERHRMRPDALDAAMAEDKRAGLIPWLAVATAGTTDTGSVDPLAAIADVASSHGAWLHVDGSYGGLFGLCEEGRRILGGIDRSDSVALDPHKGLALPLGLGAVLVKDAAAMRAAYSFEANYILRHDDSPGDPSPMDYSPELSRPFRALRLWLPLQVLGTAPFEAALEEKLLLARYTHVRLSTLDGVEVRPAPDLSVVVFRALPARGDQNEYNLRLERALLRDGRVALSSTTLDGLRFLRLAILSPRSHRDSIDLAIGILAEKLQELARE